MASDARGAGWPGDHLARWFFPRPQTEAEEVLIAVPPERTFALSQKLLDKSQFSRRGYLPSCRWSTPGRPNFVKTEDEIISKEQPGRNPARSPIGRK